MLPMDGLAALQGGTESSSPGYAGIGEEAHGSLAAGPNAYATHTAEQGMDLRLISPLLGTAIANTTGPLRPHHQGWSAITPANRN